jgi:hypothetical protein
MSDAIPNPRSSELAAQPSASRPHALTALSPAVKARIGRVAIHAAIAAVVLLAVAPLADRVGGEALDGSFKRALAALATTRGLDAAISLAQSSEVSFSLGPGGSIGIGQVLDPVNDLVEQYGTLLMTSTTALGIQQVGLRLGQSLGWWLFVPSLVALAAATAARGSMATGLTTWGRRLFALALFARLAIPTAAWIDGIVADRFLEADYLAATAVVERTTERLEDMKADGPDKPWYERLNPVKVIGEQAKQLSDTLGTAAESIVNLVIYFTVSTIVLPLGTLWLLSRTLGAIFGPRD